MPVDKRPMDFMMIQFNWVLRYNLRILSKVFERLQICELCISDDKSLLIITWRVLISSAKSTSIFQHKMCHTMKNLLLSSKLMYHENPFGELPKCIETLGPALTSIWQAFEWLTPIAWAVAIVIDIPLFPSFYCFHTHLVTFSTCLMPIDAYWRGFVMMTSSSGNIFPRY